MAVQPSSTSDPSRDYLAGARSVREGPATIGYFGENEVDLISLFS